MLSSPVLSLWLPWSYFSRLLRSCIGTVGLFLLPRPHRVQVIRCIPVYITTENNTMHGGLHIETMISSSYIFRTSHMLSIFCYCFVFVFVDVVVNDNVYLSY